jgi:hemolysin III
MNFLRETEFFSSITHFIGVLLSITALIVLLKLAAVKGNIWHIVSFFIFGASLILMYSASMIYHIIPTSNKWKKTFQKIDHSMIYILIAGSYTPLCLLCLNNILGWFLFSLIWLLAFIGIIWKSKSTKMQGIEGALSIFYYLLMGWLLIILIRPIISCISLEGFFWLLGAGICYSSGAIFFLLDYFMKRKFLINMHDIFHIFVLLGSFCYFWAILNYII